MRAMRLFAALLLAYAGAGHAELGGPPTQFNAEAATLAFGVTPAGSHYATCTTALATGTRVSEFVSAQGLVFALAWSGPVMPDLRALLGKHFDTLLAEQARMPRAGRANVAVDLPGIVINSGGHMRAFEGSAWLPSELPAGFNADAVR